MYYEHLFFMSSYSLLWRLSSSLTLLVLNFDMSISWSNFLLVTGNFGRCSLLFSVKLVLTVVVFGSCIAFTVIEVIFSVPLCPVQVIGFVMPYALFSNFRPNSCINMVFESNFVLLGFSPFSCLDYPWPINWGLIVDMKMGHFSYWYKLQDNSRVLWQLIIYCRFILKIFIH